MSLAKAVPERLKDQECEKGSCAKRLPIPYVPVIDPVQDIVNSKEHPMKIKLPDKTKIQVPIWHSGTPEAFLIHVCKAILAYKRKGYFDKYHNAVDVITTRDMAIMLLWQAAKCADAPANPPVDSTPLAPKKKKKSKEATAQAEVVEDDTALDDEESLWRDVTDQEAVLPTGGNVSEELVHVRADILVESYR
jgi:hypothetical protein